VLDERLGRLNRVDPRYALIFLTIVAGVCVGVVIDDLDLFFDDDKLLAQEFLAHYTQRIAAVRTIPFILRQFENDVLRRKLRHSVCKRSLWFALVFRNDNRFFIGFGSLRVLLGFRFIEYAELVGRNVKTIEKSSV
jgi:hypothetical protein